MKYDDIIMLSRPKSENHMPMSMHDRAAQFAPFAALTGHGAAISETARLTQKRIELDESEKEELDRKLNIIHDKMNESPSVSFTHFVEDERKEGGEYIKTTAIIKKIDSLNRTLVLKNGDEIFIEDIIEISLPSEVDYA